MVVLTTEQELRTKEVFRQYGMTNETVQRDVALIKSWIQVQPHLPDFSIINEEQLNNWIEGFLRLTKNSVERSKIAIDSYFKMKWQYPQVFRIDDLHSYIESDIFANLNMVILPKYTEDGYAILLYGMNTADASLFHPLDFYRRMRIVLDIQQSKCIDFVGIHVIIYARFGTLSHVAQFDFALLKKLFKLAKKAYPCRLKHTHIVFPPLFVEAAVRIISPFLSKKVMSRVSVHRGLQSLWRQLPKEILPSDLGGQLDSIAHISEHWKEMIREHIPWFILNDKLVLDESKRVSRNDQKKTRRIIDIGSFRKLSLD